MAARKWRTSLDGQYAFLSLTEDALEGCMDVMREAFFMHETVSIACELPNYPDAVKELEGMCMHAAKDGVSLVVIEVATKKVAAAAINIFEFPSKPFEPNYFEEYQKKCSTPSSKCLLQFMIDMGNEFDIFKHFGVDSLIEIMFLATHEKHRGHGLAKSLFECTINLASQLKNGDDVRTSIGWNLQPLRPPKLVTALCSSFITQNIAKQLGFYNVKMVDFAKWSFNGKTFAEVIGPSTSATSIDCFIL